MLLQPLYFPENPNAQGLLGRPAVVGFPVERRGKGVLRPQVLAYLLKGTWLVLWRLVLYLAPLVDAHQQTVLVRLVLSVAPRVRFVIADLDGQGDNSSLQEAATLRVCHNLLHQLILLDF